MLLPIWPWMFHTAVALANDASTGLLGSGSVTKSSANLLAVGVGAGVGLGFLGVGLFVSIVMAVVASILFLGLLMMKVVLAISTVLVFIGMPIAIVLSPVVPWISRVLVRAFAVCLAVPFVWAVCFAASAAMLNDGLFLKGSSGFFNALLEPLAAIALLWMMLLLPTRLAQMAMLGASSVRGGFMSRAVSYAAGSQVRDVARQHLPGWAGGGQRERSALPRDRLTARDAAERRERARRQQSCGRRRGAAWRRARERRVPASRAAGATARTEGPTARREPGAGWLQRVRGGANARAYSPPPLASSQDAMVASGGLQRPSWRQDHFDAEMLEASLREQRQPVSAEQARQALDALPASTQGAVQSLVADHGPRARQHLAYQALGEWTPDQREAIRTLAAASPEVRAQAFADGPGSTSGFGESADPKPAPAASARPFPRARESRGWRERDASSHAAGPAAGGSWGRLVNPAPAHLEAKLRFGWDFTVGQIAAMVGGILIGFAWANWLSPIHGIGAAVTGVYVGGLPVAAGFIASQTEFDLGAVIASAVRWRRADGRFVAGAGSTCAGYRVVAEHDPRVRRGRLARGARLRAAVGLAVTRPELDRTVLPSQGAADDRGAQGLERAAAGGG